MIASWGLLAFLKAADTRQNASFAIKLDKNGEFEEFEDELKGAGYYDAEQFIREADDLNPQRTAPRSDAYSRPAARHADREANRMRRRSYEEETRPVQDPGYTRDARQDTIIQERREQPRKRAIKYQDFDSFLDENLSNSNSGYDSNRPSGSRSGRNTANDYPSGGEQFDPLTLDDLFGGDKK